MTTAALVTNTKHVCFWQTASQTVSRLAHATAYRIGGESLVIMPINVSPKVTLFTTVTQR